VRHATIAAVAAVAAAAACWPGSWVVPSLLLLLLSRGAGSRGPVGLTASDDTAVATATRAGSGELAVGAGLAPVSDSSEDHCCCCCCCCPLELLDAGAAWLAPPACSCSSSRHACSRHLMISRHRQPVSNSTTCGSLERAGFQDPISAIQTYWRVLA
jgi:hypothetical protein